MSAAAAALPGSPLPETLRTFLAKPEAPKGAIAKLSYSHDAMIDRIIADPAIDQGELAKLFGYTEGWVSQVIASDAFQARLAARKNELIDPRIRATIEERFRSLIIQSHAKLMQKLEQPASKVSDETLLKALEVGAKALGYGARVNVNQNITQFVAHIPPKAESGSAWMREHAPTAQREPVEIENAEILPHGDRVHAQEAQTQERDATSSAPGTAALDTLALLTQLKNG